MLIGLAGLRWAAWLGLTVVALVNLQKDHHPVLVILAILATGAVTAADQLVLIGPGWSAALRPGLIARQPSDHRHSPVDVQRVAGNPASVVRREKCDGACDFLRLGATL